MKVNKKACLVLERLSSSSDLIYRPLSSDIEFRLEHRPTPSVATGKRLCIHMYSQHAIIAVVLTIELFSLHPAQTSFRQNRDYISRE